ncbi:MAG: hypothetical protein IT176_15850 [Acidobacteria bacterium]|nr:hypothetical protein [Acidobacteriota bacterium]
MTPRAIVPVIAILSFASAARAQVSGSAGELFTRLCVRCHAEDGTGKVAVPTVKTEPMDFTDCRIATPEPDADWALVVAKGGPAAGLSSEMPAFGDALSAEQIAGLVSILRGYCKERGWPHGNLNFPRPVFTEKAFPENEVVVLPALSHGADRGAGFRLRSVYEKRVGRRAHWEAGLPLESPARAERELGVGDISLAAKYVIVDDAARTAIVTGGFEVAFPTGSEQRGLGSGTTVFEPYAAAGTIARNTYLQAQIKLELPARDTWDDRELVYNFYAGRDLAARPDGWTVGVELNGANRALAFTPQIRKGLTRTGALAASGGVRVPLTSRDTQQVRWVGYLLWEYLDPVRSRP